MDYFTIKKSFFLVYSNKVIEKYEKIDNFLRILEKSGVGKILGKEHDNPIKFLNEELDRLKKF